MTLFTRVFKKNLKFQLTLIYNDVKLFKCHILKVPWIKSKVIFASVSEPAGQIDPIRSHRGMLGFEAAVVRSLQYTLSLAQRREIWF